jgi:hypothetical protein
MKTKLLAALFFLPLLFTACKKEEVTAYQTGQVAIRMKNDTTFCPYEEVNVDIRSVQIRIGGSTGGDWYKLNANAGVYNLLDLCNGIDTLIVDEKVPTGEIMAIRMNLGTNNSVRKNGMLYPVTLLTSQETGVEYEIYRMIGSTTPAKLHVVFDAAQSITQIGQESYHMHPVMWAYQDTIR